MESARETGMEESLSGSSTSPSGFSVVARGSLDGQKDMLCAEGHVMCRNKLLLFAPLQHWGTSEYKISKLLLRQLRATRRHSARAMPRVTGRREGKTGAWAMDKSYLDAAAATAPAGCAEEVKAWCVYRLDTPLVMALVSLLGTASVTELGAGVGRYARAVTAHGKTLSYTAYDGMPGIEKISHGPSLEPPKAQPAHLEPTTVQHWIGGCTVSPRWVRHGDLANASLALVASDYVLTFEMARACG
eukprot:scaffold7047_cov65-Phaeocystis_antarctica.AAC.1